MESNINDPYNLKRFIDAQESIYPQALAELRNGRKRSHWMWFIFPQVDGLGFSAMSKYYAIQSLAEARQYLEHPLLGNRLRECAQALLALAGHSASDIFGYPDNLKLKSSMTLFEQAAGAESDFAAVLEKYYGGERDQRTREILDKLKS